MIGRWIVAIARLGRRRQDRQTIESWAGEATRTLVDEARRRSCDLPTSVAGQRLFRASIGNDAELLVLLREVRVEVCQDHFGAEVYQHSGLHFILLALKQREDARLALRAPALGVFR